jgi:hypothetical protein
MGEEPCQRYLRAADLVDRAAKSLDPVVEQRELEDMARRLRAASAEVHSVSCLAWQRIRAAAPAEEKP